MVGDWLVCRLSFEGSNAECSGTPTFLNRLGILRDQAIHYYSPVAFCSTGAVAQRDRFIDIYALSFILYLISFCTRCSWMVVAVKILGVQAVGAVGASAEQEKWTFGPMCRYETERRVLAGGCANPAVPFPFNPYSKHPRVILQSPVLTIDV